MMLMEQCSVNTVMFEKLQENILRYSRKTHPLALRQPNGESLHPEQLQSLYDVLLEMHASLARDMAFIKLHLPDSPGVIHQQSDESSMRRLSRKERQVLNMFARGYTYSEAANLLGCKLGTIQTYAKRLYRKLNVHSRAEAIFEASHLGLIQM